MCVIHEMPRPPASARIVFFALATVAEHAGVHLLSDDVTICFSDRVATISNLTTGTKPPGRKSGTDNWVCHFCFPFFFRGPMSTLAARGGVFGSSDWACQVVAKVVGADPYSDVAVLQAGAGTREGGLWKAGRLREQSGSLGEGGGRVAVPSC